MFCLSSSHQLQKKPTLSSIISSSSSSPKKILHKSFYCEYHQTENDGCVIKTTQKTSTQTSEIIPKKKTRRRSRKERRMSAHRVNLFINVQSEEDKTSVSRASQSFVYKYEKYERTRLNSKRSESRTNLQNKNGPINSVGVQTDEITSALDEPSKQKSFSNAKLNVNKQKTNSSSNFLTIPSTKKIKNILRSSSKTSVMSSREPVLRLFL